MKVPATQQAQLLALQALDTSRAQLAHRRDNLPEAAELDTLAGSIAEAAATRDVQQAEVADIDKRIADIEADIDTVRTRAARDQARADAGTITTPRELESLQHEIQTLTARQAELEDRELELMEEREPVAALLAETEAAIAKLEAEQADAAQRRDAALEQIRVTDASTVEERAVLVDGLPTELVALYEKIRERGAGVGAALLKAKRCGGCRLEISGTELARIRAAADDDVLRCEECGRILIRTAESGL